MNMPVSSGWHPYFFVQDNVNEVQLQLPECSVALQMKKRFLLVCMKKTKNF